MSIKDRFLLARKRLRHCNYILFGFLVALAGFWSEIKPLVADMLQPYLSPQNVGLVLSGLGVLVIVIRAGAAMQVPKDDGESQ